MIGCDSSFLFYFMTTSLAENQENIIEFSDSLIFFSASNNTFVCEHLFLINN